MVAEFWNPTGWSCRDGRPVSGDLGSSKTEVEPASFASGQTIVSAFQVGRVFNGASANIGFATSVNGGRTWIHGFLPASTINATPPGTYARASDASVAYDLRDHTWLISWLGAPSITSNAIVDVRSLCLCGRRQ
jgi:hypothetical protein